MMRGDRKQSNKMSRREKEEVIDHRCLVFGKRVTLMRMGYERGNLAVS
jgi:hypothetical protein